MLRRKAEETLRQWADSDSRKCLMIRGARQVGKTFLADRLGEQFNQYVRINFLETPAMAAIFSGNLDVETLLHVFRSLIDHGATVIIIEHDLDVIRNADYVIDMGPGGGVHGGRIVAAGTPAMIHENPDSITGQYM